MDFEWIIRIVLFSIIHWILAGVLIQDISVRDKVFGKHKPVWVILMLIVPCFGSIIYLLFHPQVLNPPKKR